MVDSVGSRWYSNGEELEIKAAPAPVLASDQPGWLLVHESDLGPVDANTGLVKIQRSDMMRVEVRGKLPDRQSS